MLDGGKAISTPVGESKVIANRDGDSLVARLAGSTGSIFLPPTMTSDGPIKGTFELREMSPPATAARRNRYIARTGGEHMSFLILPLVLSS